MKYVFIFTVTLSICAVNAQTLTRLALTYHKKLHNIHELPFNSVVVYDNRYDTTKIKIRQDGDYPVKVIDLNMPASMAVKDYIETAIAKFPKKDQVLYLNIKQMRFTNVHADLFFWAEAYLKRGNGFRQITTLKKSYEIHYQGYVDSAYRRTVTRALNELIEKVGNEYKVNSSSEINADTFNTVIGSDVMTGWKQYPVINDYVSGNGVFETFEDFKNNKSLPVDFSVEIHTDSNYRVYFPENSKYYNKKKREYNHVYAISYKGKIYLDIIGRYFLPVHKVNNTFYFNIPGALPNMYATLSENSLYTQNSFDNKMAYTNNPVTSLIGAGVGIVQQNKVNKQVYEKKREILDNGLNNADMRICFLDMDTGDFIYY